MIICDLRFEMEDKQHPGYSLVEIDFYGSIPWKFYKEMKNHLLTVWKNLKENKFEVVTILHDARRTKDVLFSSESLQEALDYGCRQWNHYWGYLGEMKQRDLICDHSGNYNTSELGCPKIKDSFRNKKLKFASAIRDLK